MTVRSDVIRIDETVTQLRSDVMRIDKTVTQLSSVVNRLDKDVAVLNSFMTMGVAMNVGAYLIPALSACALTVITVNTIKNADTVTRNEAAK